MKSKRKYELKVPGLGSYYFYAYDSESALDFIFDELLFEVEEDRPLTREEYLENEADNSRKECA